MRTQVLALGSKRVRRLAGRVFDREAGWAAPLLDCCIASRQGKAVSGDPARPASSHKLGTQLVLAIYDHAAVTRAVLLLLLLASTKTLLTKLVFANHTWMHFTFPVVFSAISALSTGVVILVLFALGVAEPRALARQHWGSFGVVSVLTIIDIACTNMAIAELSATFWVAQA